MIGLIQIAEQRNGRQVKSWINVEAIDALQSSSGTEFTIMTLRSGKTLHVYEKLPVLVNRLASLTPGLVDS